MRKIIKECLIAAVVIIAILILVIPLLFKDKDLRKFSHFGERMLPPPSLPQVQAVAPNLAVQPGVTLPQDISGFIPPEHVTAQESIAAILNRENHFLQTATAANQAWVLQLGSFSNAQYAVNLVNELNQQGYNAFSYETIFKGVTVTRVYIGPVVQQAQAQALLVELKSKLNLTGIVVSFDATSMQ